MTARRLSQRPWRGRLVVAGGVLACAVIGGVALVGPSGGSVARAVPPGAAPAATAAPANAGNPDRAMEPQGAGEPPADATQPPEPPPKPPRPGVIPDLAKLRADYDRIREELFQARVRSQKVAEAAYPSKLSARLRWKGSPDFVIRRARFQLDGGELWNSADRAQADDLIDIAARSVKPGPHAFTVWLEVRPKTEKKGGAKTGLDQLGYTTEHTFAIVVAETGTTALELTADEDGDPPEYEPELELEVDVEK